MERWLFVKPSYCMVQLSVFSLKFGQVYYSFQCCKKNKNKSNIAAPDLTWIVWYVYPLSDMCIHCPDFQENTCILIISFLSSLLANVDEISCLLKLFCNAEMVLLIVTVSTVCIGEQSYNGLYSLLSFRKRPRYSMPSSASSSVDLMLAVSRGFTFQICLIIALSFRCIR